MKINSILTILDKPKHPQSAFSVARKLQRATHAQLDLIAFRFNALYDHDHTLEPKQRKLLRKQMVAESNAWMQQLTADKVAQESTRMRTIWAKDIARWLADEQHQRPVDLVVKALRRRKTLLYTPTDWQILRTCDAPLLLTGDRKTKKGSNVILAAVDFSSTSARRRKLNRSVMNAAQTFAVHTGAKVHAIFAIEFSDVLRDLDMIDSKVSKKKVLKHIMPDVEEFQARYDLPKSRMHFPVGKAGRVINSKAHQLNADLLVVGRGTHRLRQVVGLGSTAERVLTKAHRDVLLVRP